MPKVKPKKVVGSTKLTVTLKAVATAVTRKMSADNFNTRG